MITSRINVPRTWTLTQQKKLVDCYQIVRKLPEWLSTCFFYIFILYIQLSIYYSITMYILYFVRHLIPEKYYPKLFYPIEDEIISASTRVIFTRSKHNNQQICLKLWQLYDQKVCNEKLVTRDINYLLEGFEFNLRFAPDIYLGIVPVELSNDKKNILRGRLIEKPEKCQLKTGVEYALMMRRLEEKYRLDFQLKQRGKGIATRAGMEFLAREVALMHVQLDQSPHYIGGSVSILSKLKINIELFDEALNKSPNGYKHLEKYKWISNFMMQACKTYTNYFEQRREENHIRRCHGDLKATNLWIFPEKRAYFLGMMKRSQQLIALDCVDFNPDFCHIDTLSDVAMLAIDLEMHVTKSFDKSIDNYHGQKLAKHFLHSYLREIRETSIIAWPLLEYYLTEKGMVCAYVSILYDNHSEQGEKYLNIALIHARRLEKMLKQSAKSTTSMEHLSQHSDFSYVR